MYAKECVRCGAAFETGNIRKTKCKPDCGRHRTSETKNALRTIARENHEIEFIGVDGEGVNVYVEVYDVDEETGEEITIKMPKHHYVLFSVGSESLHKDGAELTHHDIFAFLWQQFEAHPTACFVGFFLGYDFTNWLKSIPDQAARDLLTKEGIARRQPAPETGVKFPWPVRDGGWGYRDGHRVRVDTHWEFDLLANKRFKLRPYIPPDQVPTKTVVHKDGSASQEKIPRPWMYICDAGSFFQSSFLTAIHPKQWSVPIVTDDEYAAIERGKTHRADAKFDDDMISYNVLENEVMSRLMKYVNEGFVADGIRLNRNQFFGPGQAAQAWMKLIGVPTGAEIREAVPDWARDAARKTYYGGWFEIFNHGPVPGTSYAYDINSAYPHIISTLPCLLHGTWSRGTGTPPRIRPRALRMVSATVRGPLRTWVGAMPHRNSDGSILRPVTTKGWYWWDELQASKRAGFIVRTEIHEWIDYQPCKCDPPMAAISTLYEGRLQVGKNSPAGKGKKLVYNSAYGKLAQSVGEPRFSNSIWASRITSGCRTQILNAIATHPTRAESLLMVATDGIVFKEPHPSLEIHATKLGAWDADEYENLSLFMPGLYWDDTTRRQIAAGEAPKLKSRGVRAKDLSTVIDRVDRLWTRRGPDHKPPVVNLSIEFALITAKQAAVRNAWWTCGDMVYGAVRVLDAKPDTKRDPRFVTAWGGLRSLPYDRARDLETTYYDKTFGEPMADNEDDIGDLVTPDGTIAEIQAFAFRR